MDQLSVLIVPVVVVVIVVALLTWLARHYHRVPPNEVMVVYGRKSPRLITNGGVFILPVLETFKKLDLTIMTIKTIKDEVYTVSGVPIQLDWVAQVQIDGEAEALRTAAKAFLDKTREEVRTVVEETLSANFRAIVGQMTVEAIHRDRDDFIQRVQDLASDDVAAMGVRVISMGIEEITDNQGYLQAMAAPQIAAVKRDAMIAEAEAQREARMKAANAKRQAEQAELDAEREILAQREALQLREAEVLVPARAERQALEIRSEAERRRIEIEAEAERNRVTINADAQAQSTRQRADAEAEAIERKGRADAIALEAMKKAEAEGVKAEADGVRARLLAEAEGEKAKLIAVAEGRRELAAATAAEDAINLRQLIIEEVTKADVAKVQAISQALAGQGGNVRMVQFGNSGNGSSNGNSFMEMLMNIPEVAEMFRTKVEALSGEDFENTIERVAKMFKILKSVDGGDETAMIAPLTSTAPHVPPVPPTPPIAPLN